MSTSWQNARQKTPWILPFVRWVLARIAPTPRAWAREVISTLAANVMEYAFPEAVEKEPIMPTADQLTEAYEAWRRATDEHVEMMRAVTFGAPLDAQAMKQQVGRIDELHTTWMDMVQRRDDPPS